MNNLFIDLIYDGKSIKSNIIDILCLKMFGFIITEDKLLKTKKSRTLFLRIQEEAFLKNKRNTDFLKIVFKSNIRNVKNLNIVFSKNIKDSKLKKYLQEVISLINENCNYIKAKNNLKGHVKDYIQNYIEKTNIDSSKFKILLVLDNIKDFYIEDIKRYISEYKFVDILRMPNILKNDYKRMSKIINDINNEFGSSIEIIQKRDVQNYDFYIICTKSKKEYFNTHYILNKKSYVLDITDVDDDVLSKEYKLYIKNKGYIDTLFDRMNLNKDSFYKIEMGILYN